jgi:hypothetical protein
MRYKYRLVRDQIFHKALIFKYLHMLLEYAKFSRLMLYEIILNFNLNNILFAK